MKIKFQILYLLSWLCLLSCDKYLDVKPKDQFLAESVFENKFSIYNALNGIYMSLGQKNLYGENMSMTVVDILAQYYTHTNTWVDFGTYNYTEAKIVEPATRQIWSSSYSTIMNINSFINGLKSSTANLATEEKNLLLGEVYALRAYLHFDIFRLFGPIYKSDSSLKSIPYLKHPTSQIQPLLAGKEVIQNLIADIDTSLSLLDSDPVIMSGVDNSLGSDPSVNFFKLRNRRMNYYAVLALKARIELYAGEKLKAYNSSQKVINESKKWFPWSSEASSSPNIDNPDRIFSSEILFGVDNYTMYESFNTIFDASVLPQNILAPRPERLTEAFEGDENDFRYRANWISGASGGKSFRVFIKYKDIVNKDSLYRNLQPMIRMSEMYLISAECAETNAESLTYLNAVRINRGKQGLESISNRMDVIMKEYKREFWGEGQMFYFYKRNGISTIPSGNSATGNISMNNAKYVVPLPKSEILNRN